MAPERIADIELDRCPTCRGLWFDAIELDRYVATGGRAARRQLALVKRLPAAGELTCPRCTSATLEGFRAGGVYLSRCRSCHGVYLDGSDLVRLDGRRLRFLPNFPNEPFDQPVQTVLELALAMAAEVFLANPF